ncbi:transcriptional regulator [Streptomyces europaeiscabiei]|uniref:transcriptional regulator n=1 Tax=Streptomyces europaeiscabiei TaxID=146819 RepID=UPI0029AF44EB|nr:transcriptional regulator [Streptomyces europaeiscabiei]MDX3557424.1 transcriptional regulator [Streptomyces europaeiscabiei]
MTGPKIPPALDKEIHHPTRLAVAAFLSGCAEAEFGAVRDYCGVSDSVMSKTVTALEKAGYVSVRKGYLGKRPRTWISVRCGKGSPCSMSRGFFVCGA